MVMKQTFLIIISFLVNLGFGSSWLNELAVRELVASQTVLALQADIEADTLAVAAQLYENGRFLEAAQTYQQLVDQGFASSDLYYNLGNAYFQAGDMGGAVLNLERAARLAPRDATIAAELSFVRDQVQADLPAAGLEQVARLARDWLTLNETAVLALLFWWLLLALVWAGRRWEKWRSLTTLGWQLSAVLLVISLFLLGSRIYTEQNQPLAVVVASEVGVSQTPGSGNTGALILFGGTPVQVLEQRAQWSEVLAADGTGWVPNRAIALIEGNQVLGD